MVQNPVSDFSPLCFCVIQIQKHELPFGYCLAAGCRMGTGQPVNSFEREDTLLQCNCTACGERSRAVLELHLGWLPVIHTLSAHSIQSLRIYYEEYRHACLWAFSPGYMPIVQQVMLLGKSKPPLLSWLAKFSGCRFNCKIYFLLGGTPGIFNINSGFQEVIWTKNRSAVVRFPDTSQHSQN